MTTPMVLYYASEYYIHIVPNGLLIVLHRTPCLCLVSLVSESKEVITVTALRLVDINYFQRCSIIVGVSSAEVDYMHLKLCTASRITL